MQKNPSWRLERQFGRSVGFVLAALGAWMLFRRGGALGTVLTTAGSLLLLLSVVRPQWLSRLRYWWMKLADALSFVSTRIILGVVFALILTPIGLVRRVMGADPLRRRSPARGTGWTPYPVRQHDPRHYEKMY